MGPGGDTAGTHRPRAAFPPVRHRDRVAVPFPILVVMTVPPPAAGAPGPAQRRTLAAIQADLERLIRYDDESIVNGKWARQRYDCGCFPRLAAARAAAVAAAWHEAGHAVAALAVGARFSSASIHHSPGTEGRVHGIRGAGEFAFVIDAAGQIAERLRTWSVHDRDEDLRAWLAGWQRDGGDARHFRRSLAGPPARDEVTAWRHSEQVLTPLRLAIRQVARALLVYPRHLPYPVVAALAAQA